MGSTVAVEPASISNPELQNVKKISKFVLRDIVSIGASELKVNKFIFKLMMNFVLDVIFPKFCIYCGSAGKFVCADCLNSKFDIVGHECHVCRKVLTGELCHPECLEKTFLDGVVIYTKYSKDFEKLIAEVKYGQYYKIIDDLYPLLLKQKLEIKQLGIDYLVPIPLHKFKKRQRGFNQAELISRQLSKLSKIPTVDLIERVRKTKTQVGMSRAERVTNLNGAFELNPKFQKPNPKLDGKVIGLVDDIMTTGSTLEECAELLKDYGVGKVYGIVLARG